MSGLITLTAEIPMPDFAMPYAAPRLERNHCHAASHSSKKGLLGLSGVGGLRNRKGFEPHDGTTATTEKLARLEVGGVLGKAIYHPALDKYNPCWYWLGETLSRAGKFD